MSGRTIGVLGGMGPEATVDLLREITRLTPARTDQDHIRILAYSNPKIPDRTLAIVGRGEDPLPALLSSARLLERAGAGILAIPCNAAHHYLSGLRAGIMIPILDMIAETCEYLRASFPNSLRAGLLAATGTVVGGLYRRACEARGLSLMVPEEQVQRLVQGAIRQIKAGCHDRAVADVLHSAGRSLIDRGAEALILGCTELPLVFDYSSVDQPVVNPTVVLAQSAVDWALGRRS